jgi:hypothetical protein
LFNFKLSGFAAGAAFVLSLLVGFISGTGFSTSFLRALIFAAVFFALSVLIFWLLAQFLPELLSGGEDDQGFSGSGSRVDISLGDDGASGAFPADDSESVDDIAGRPTTPAKTASPPLDQKENTGYNEVGELEFASDGQDFRTGSEMPVKSGESLPDIEGLTETATESAANEVEADDIGIDNPEPRRMKTSSKNSDMARDFDPQELAQAIRTLVKKDDKG